MLTITFHNDGTGTHEVGNYDVAVKINGTTITKRRIEGHRRSAGWQALLAMLVNEEDVECCRVEWVYPWGPYGFVPLSDRSEHD